MHPVEWLLETRTELGVSAGTEHHQGSWKAEIWILLLFPAVVRGDSEDDD